jgi:uncharacterized protein (TIRG00374 family)
VTATSNGARAGPGLSDSGSTRDAAAPLTTVGRHPGDVLRVALGLVLLAVTVVVVRLEGTTATERDVFALVNRLPALIDLPLRTVMQAGALATVVVVVVLALLTHRPRFAASAGLAAIVAWGAAQVLKPLVDRGRPVDLFGELARASTSGLGFPSAHTAVAAALATTAAPYVPRGWRRILWAGVLAVAFARIFVGAAMPLDAVGGAALGWAIGSAVLLALGAPSRLLTGPSLDRAVVAVLGPGTTVRPLEADARGSTPFLATTADGEERFVKVLTDDERDADALFKVARFLSYRQVEDEAPFTTVRHAVEHEAYAGLAAARLGVRVPEVLGTAGDGSLQILATTMVPDSEGLDQIADDARVEAALPALWQQVATLHTGRIAHRDLRLANVMLDRDGQPWLIDFGFAEVAASERRLALDVAQLLVSTATVVGAPAAVAAAVQGLGDEAVSAAAPFLQEPAVSRATRTLLKQHHGLLDALRHELATATGSEPVPLEKLVRVTRTNIALLVVAAVTLYVLIPRLAELGEAGAALRQAEPGWALTALACAVATYLFAGAELLAAAPARLPYWRTVQTQLAATFANCLAPGSIGGLGVNIRFLQRHGLDSAQAGTAAATSSGAAALAHVTLLVLALWTTGRRGLPTVALPGGWFLLVGIAVALAVAGIVVLRRSSWRARIVHAAKEALDQTRALARRPARATTLVFTAFGLTGAYILCAIASVRAFTDSVPATAIAVAYLVGATVSAAAPTPGGLGAMEAALVAGLTAIGVTAPDAVAAMLLFRLLTWWLPIAPGGVALSDLRRHHQV